MTKKDLERRNKFLLLQLKIISEMVNNPENMHGVEVHKTLGAIQYYSNSQTIKSNLEFIETYNKEYNFFNSTMDIKEYE